MLGNMHTYISPSSTVLYLGHVVYSTYTDIEGADLSIYIYRCISWTAAAAAYPTESMHERNVLKARKF